MTKHLFAASLVSGALAGASMYCLTGPLADAGAAFDPDARILWVGEYNTEPFDAKSGDALMIVMNPLGDWVGRCLDYGGMPTVMFPQSDPTFVCSEPDF